MNDDLDVHGDGACGSRAAFYVPCVVQHDEVAVRRRKSKREADVFDIQSRPPS